MQKIILEKGYTVICKSWEQDSDFWETNQITVESKAEALEFRDLCLFVQDKTLCIGNSRKYKENQINGIIEFIKSKEIIFADFLSESPSEKEYLKAFKSAQFEILGEPKHESLECRYCSSVEVVFTSRDLVAEILES